MRRLGRLVGTVVGAGTLASSSLAAAWLSGPPASASTSIVVTNCADQGAGSLPAAVSAADAAPGATITFQQGLSCPAAAPILLIASLELSADVTITGPGPATMVISGNSGFRPFVVDPSVIATISGLTITKGQAPMGTPGTDATYPATTTAGGPGADGGGVVNNGNLTLVDDVLSDNSAGSGGSGGSGYGINGSPPGSSGSDGGSGGSGGAVYNTGSLTVSSSTFLGNSAGGGGAAGLGFDAALASGTGGAGGSGGAIFSTGTGTMNLTNDTFSGNAAGAGGDDSGGMGTAPGTPGNGGNGGALGSSGNLSVTNSTFDANLVGAGGTSAIPGVSGSAGVGGGIYDQGTPGSGSLLGTILTGNSATGSVGSNCAGTPLADGGSNLEDDTSCFSAAAENTTAGAIGLAALADNGGPVPTEAITASSAAYHLEPSGSCPPTDARGVPRVQPSGSTSCDAGAYELVDLSLTAASTPYGTPLPLATGANGAVSFAVTSAGTAGCSLSGSASLTASAVGTCMVTATLGALSFSSTVTVTVADQAALSITTPTATYGSPLALSTSGGSGAGALSYSVVDPGTAGCSVTGATLSSTGDGACTVTASLGGNADYHPVSSTPTTITVLAAPQAQLSLTTTAGTDGTLLTLSTSGGSGSGAVSYTVDDRGSAGCFVAGALLLSTSAGTCTVTATKAGDALHDPASSPATTITIAPAPQTTTTTTATPTTTTLAGSGSSGGSTTTVTHGNTAGTTHVGKAAAEVHLWRTSARIAVGHEQVELLIVTVTGPSNLPAATGRVRIGHICVATLRAGVAECRLGARGLRPGWHRSVAVYFGNRDLRRSRSNRVRIQVVPA